MYEGWLCSYSRAENSVSVLALQALAAGSLGAADDNINRSNLSNAVSPSPYNSRSRSETPNVLLDLSRADKTNQQYRSPMVYSRESSLEFEFSRDPAHPERKSPTAAASAILSSTLYGHHPGSDAALRSLLTPANLQARSSRSGAVPVTQQRAGGLTGTSGLMSSIRSQPLLYSCGTSGGSSNSNSAYHIRKKRAAQGGIPSHSPVPSPRPSPSSFLFDSSVRVDSFGAMAMDVDLSPAAFRTRDSPQDLSNHSYQNLHDLSANGEIRGTGGASFSDTSNAELSGPPEVYLTCVARVKLPTSPLPHPGSQLSASFSGGFDMVVSVGLLIQKIN